MKLQVYNRTDRIWFTIMTFAQRDGAVVREHAAQLGKIGAPEIAGIRITENQRIVAHWNALQGWVDHVTPDPQPKPQPKTARTEQAHKHPEYVKPQHQRRKGPKKNDDRVKRCLKCRKTFFSEGPHNRLCNLCRGNSDPMAVYNSCLPEQA